MDFLRINQAVWDKNVENSNIWTQPVSTEEIIKAKNGEWHIVVTPIKEVPREWFPELLKGREILCLASGGGQQGPILAATGASVTVFDNSQNQLIQDMMVSQRDDLGIKTVKGDMRDLSVFENDSFDVIVHPWSNVFIDDVLPVWKEAYRVLKKGGILISGFGNPIEYIFDLDKMNAGELVVRHKIPYSDLTSISTDELNDLVLNQGEAIVFGHSLEDQIAGQIKAGFLIGGFYEDISGSPLNEYINTSIATKAIKL
jgi:SAM-dependent methyltransferase